MPGNLAIIVKLGMIRFATSLLVVLTTNVLNRVLIVEYQLPATLIAFIFAFQHVVTPSGLIAGYFSDRLNQRRKRRTPFILGGMLLSLAVMPFFPWWGLAFAVRPDSSELLWLGVLLFTIFGVGTTVSATAINALLVDETPEEERGSGMTLVWILTLAGFILGAVFFQALFPDDPINRLEIIFGLFTAVALVITLWCLRGIETKKPGSAARSTRGVGITIILRAFAQSSQALVFFVFLAASIFFLAMQSFILTPYGGDILRLPVGETAKFGMYTSYGTLLGMGLAYWCLRRHFGDNYAIYLIAGLFCGAAAFGLLSWSAWQPQKLVGLAGLWLLGFSRGLYNVGLSFLTMRLAHPVFSGVYMGLWNLVSGLGLAAGEMVGGFFLDQVLRAAGSLEAAYALVFFGEGLGLLGSLLLLWRLDIGRYWRQLSRALLLPVAKLEKP